MKARKFIIIALLLIPTISFTQYSGNINFTDQYSYTNIHGWRNDVCSLNDSTFVIAWKGATPTEPGMAVIGNIVDDTLIQYSQEFIYSQSSGMLHPIRIARMDTNKIVIVYNRHSPLAVIGIISGNTLSFGAEFDLKIGDDMHYMDVVDLDKDHFIVGYTETDAWPEDTLTYVEYCGVSGNQIYSIHDTTLVDDNVLYLDVTSMNANSFVFSYEKDSDGVARAGEIVNDRIVLGPEEVYTYNYSQYSPIIAVNDSTIIISYQVMPYLYSMAIAGIVSGNQLSFGTPATFINNRIVSLNATTLGENEFVLTYDDDLNIYEPKGTATYGEVSGLDINFLATDVWSLRSSTSHCPCAGLDDDSFIVIFKDTISWLEGWAKKGTVRFTPDSALSVIPQLSICAGSISVPLICDDLDDIIEFDLSVSFDTSLLAYTSFQNVNAALNLDSLAVSSDASVISMHYSCNSAFNLNNDTLLELQFTSGIATDIDTTQILWIDSLNYYINSNLDTVGSVFLEDSLMILPYPAEPGVIVGNTQVCLGDTCQTYYISAVLNAQQYHWSIIPDTAATLSMNDTMVEVCFTPIFTGQATLSVFASNDCGNSDDSYISIDIVEPPMSNAGPDASLCENENYKLDGLANNSDSVFWTTSGDGTFDDPYILKATYTFGPVDISNGLVDLTMDAFAICNCFNPASDDMRLNIDFLPQQAQIPVGPENITLQPNLSSEYFTYAVENANGYDWYLKPTEAGSITAFDTSATVYWNDSFMGVMAFINVGAVNDCGEHLSDTLSVNITPVGIPSRDTEPEIHIAPNPSTGIVYINIKRMDQAGVIYILNSLGRKVEKGINISSAENNLKIDLSDHPSGLYYIQILTGDQIVLKKLLLVN